MVQDRDIVAMYYYAIYRVVAANYTVTLSDESARLGLQTVACAFTLVFSMNSTTDV